jgi:transcription antitermination factor NusG
MNDHGWFVVQSHPRKERFVRDRIADLGIETFLPLIRERGPGQVSGRTGPFFPSYLFAKLSHGSGDLPRVRWTPGVKRVLGDGERPRPLPEEVVSTIRMRADRYGHVKPGAELKRGDRVRILDGPLAGLVGVLDRPATRPEDRVSVLVDLFQRITRVDLRVDEIRGAGSAGS